MIDEYDSYDDEQFPAEALSPEFQAKLTATVGAALQLRRYVFQVCGAATGHRLKPPVSEARCGTCKGHWPCVEVQRAAAPILHYVADLHPRMAPVTESPLVVSP